MKTNVLSFLFFLLFALAFCLFARRERGRFCQKTRVRRAVLGLVRFVDIQNADYHLLAGWVVRCCYQLFNKVSFSFVVKKNHKVMKKTTK